MSDEDLCANCGHARANHGREGVDTCTDGRCGCSRFFEAEDTEE